MIDIKTLRDNYFNIKPDVNDPGQLVSFGTSGHRGSPDSGTFNEMHIAAIVQATVDYRNDKGIKGFLFLGMDSHAASLPAMMTAIEVLAANDVEVRYETRSSFDDKGGFTPTPSVSFAILEENKVNKFMESDGIIITPSHNPPSDGGIKYNPPTGGPADSVVTGWIEKKANQYLKEGNIKVKRTVFEKAVRKSCVRKHDFIFPYVQALRDILDLEAIRASGISIGADPLGGAALEYLDPIADIYKLKLEVVNPNIDMTFSFMPPDRDSKIRMDCSSPYSMKKLIALKDRYDLAWGNDTDSDRHGIVTKSSGLMNPNHYLSVAVSWLFSSRKGWGKDLGVGKTAVSSSMIDRVVSSLGRNLFETPVGFKYFVEPLLNKMIAFGGEESAGASFARKDGSVWTTDKDGIIMGLLAAEILALTGKDPGTHYKELTDKFGSPVYERIDTPASPSVKAKLKALSSSDIKASTLAGERIENIVTAAPSGDPLGGLKVSTHNGWFAARPSGTEDIAKLYAESFIGSDHLKKIQDEARAIILSATS